MKSIYKTIQYTVLQQLIKIPCSRAQWQYSSREPSSQPLMYETLFLTIIMQCHPFSHCIWHSSQEFRNRPCSLQSTQWCSSSIIFHAKRSLRRRQSQSDSKLSSDWTWLWSHWPVGGSYIPAGMMRSETAQVDRVVFPVGSKAYASCIEHVGLPYRAARMNDVLPKECNRNHKSQQMTVVAELKH